MSQSPIVIKSKDLPKLRRVALAAQGLHQADSFGRGLSGTRKTINHLGYVQIDTISVVERAHHHVLFSRVSNYQPKHLHRLLANKDIFEYWSHAAAFLPIKDFRFSLPFKHSIRRGEQNWTRSRDHKLMQEVLARITVDGPLRSRDLEAPDHKTSGWWNWKPTKKALEQLFMQGDLMVVARDGFQKTYDLTERVLPDNVDTRDPSHEEFAEFLINQALSSHALVTLKGITYLRRDAKLRLAAKSQVEQMVSEGKLQRLKFEQAPDHFCYPGLLDKRMPHAQQRVVILSPFDHSIIQRSRLNDLFDYDYQIECYVPEKKRKFGYFCLPLLYKDQFIGLMDCKSHRKNGGFEIKNLHLGADINPPPLPLLAQAIEEFAQFQFIESGLKPSITVTKTNRKGIKMPLSKLLN